MNEPRKAGRPKRSFMDSGVEDTDVLEPSPERDPPRVGTTTPATTPPRKRLFMSQDRDDGDTSEVASGPRPTALDDALEIVTGLDEKAPLPEGHPKALGVGTWSLVPPDWQKEAKERCAMLAMRGNHPDAALMMALDDMREQEDDVGTPLDWPTVNALAYAHVQPSRDSHHRPFADVVEMSMVVVSAVEAEITLHGAVDNVERYLSEFGMSGNYLRGGVEAFWTRFYLRLSELGLSAPQRGSLAPPEVVEPIDDGYAGLDEWDRREQDRPFERRDDDDAWNTF